METYPTLEMRPPVPPPATVPPEVEEIPFRPYRVFTWWTALPFLIIPIITTSLENSGRAEFDWAFFFLTGVILGIAALFILVPRGRTKSKGGIPPLRFEAEAMEIPVSAGSRRKRRVPYPDILSLGRYGKGGRGAVIIQTKRRTFSYPLRAFAGDDAAGRLRDILNRRITARADGASQWRQMETREALAGVLGAVRPLGSWAMLCVIAAVFAAQSASGGSGLFDYIIMGANVPSLVGKGEWYRLVTANLLHYGHFHLIWNALFGFIIAPRVERQLGSRRFILLLLSTALVSQCASAAWNLYDPADHILSVGISGALLGMLGALAVLHFRFGAQSPGIYRITARALFALSLNFLLLPLLVNAVDLACHVGGFLSGIVMGWMLCRGQTDITQPPPFGTASRLALSLLSAVWLAAIAQAAVNYHDPATRIADRATVIQAMLAMPEPSADDDNRLAWEIATGPSSTSDELASAQALATRARVSAQTTAGGKTTKDLNAVSDTLATVEYRQGHLDRAITIEEPLFTQDPLYSSQLARFLNGYLQVQHKPRLIEMKEAPAITLAAPSKTGDRGFEVTLPEPSLHGAEVYALLMLGGKPAGILNVSVWPNKAKASGVLLKTAFDEAAADAKAAGEFSLVVAQADATGCRCIGDPDASANYVPVEPDIAKLP